MGRLWRCQSKVARQREVNMHHHRQTDSLGCNLEITGWTSRLRKRQIMRCRLNQHCPDSTAEGEEQGRGHFRQPIIGDLVYLYTRIGYTRTRQLVSGADRFEIASHAFSRRVKIRRKQIAIGLAVALVILAFDLIAPLSAAAGIILVASKTIVQI